jgi:hypothetical protein
MRRPQALREVFETIAAACDQNEIVATGSQTIGINGADAR